MPLNRVQHARSEKSKSVTDYTTDKQYQRTAGLNLVDANRPATPQRGANDRPQSQTRPEHVNGRSNPPAAGGEHAFDLGLESNNVNLFQMQMHKVAVPNTMALSTSKSQQRVGRSHSRSQSQQQKQNGSNGEEQVKAQMVSAFDDTTSIGPSMLEDSNLDENLTPVNDPQAEPPRQHEPQDRHHANHQNHESDAYYDAQDMIEQLGFGPNWKQELAEERAYQAEKAGLVPTPRRGTNPFNYSLAKNNKAERVPVELFGQPETPSRVRSVPPGHVRVHAPIPRRSVGFVNSPQVMGGISSSPKFRSEELAREDSPAMSIPRPNSAHQVSHSMPIHQRPQQLQPNLDIRQQPSQPSHVPQSNRFQSMQDHRNRAVQQEQKVSAPESDVQDSSEDERARIQLEGPKTIFHKANDALLTSRKRALEDVNILDYDADVLTKKTLAELQKEPYIQNPRAPGRTPAIDSNGNEMTLRQILENLGRVTAEQQRATFNSLTDEEWAQTGQWFVDKFQTDLTKLMEVRLKRRQIALTFEHKVRRRQRQVEYQQAGVEKQLKELQEGGTGLLKDRPATSGSRSGTPLRTPRG